MTIVGIGLSPLIPYTHWQCSLCSLLLPIFTALPSSLTHPDSALSVHSSYHSLLPTPHPLHTLTAYSLFTPPTTLCCPPLIPCITWQHFLFSILLPLFASLPSSLAQPDNTFSVHSSYHSLILSSHPLQTLTATHSVYTSNCTLVIQSLKFMFYSVPLLVAVFVLLCPSAAALLVLVIPCTVFAKLCRTQSIQLSSIFCTQRPRPICGNVFSFKHIWTIFNVHKLITVAHGQKVKAYYYRKQK